MCLAKAFRAEELHLAIGRALKNASKLPGYWLIS